MPKSWFPAPLHSFFIVPSHPIKYVIKLKITVWTSCSKSTSDPHACQQKWHTKAVIIIPAHEIYQLSSFFLLHRTLCWANLQEFPNVDIEGSCFGSKHVKVPSTMNDKFTDLLAIAQGRIDKKTPKNHDKIVIHDKFSKDNPTWGEVTNFVFR